VQPRDEPERCVPLSVALQDSATGAVVTGGGFLWLIQRDMTYLQDVTTINNPAKPHVTTPGGFTPQPGDTLSVSQHMSGAPVVIAKGAAIATVNVTRQPIPSARMSNLIFEDQHPLNGEDELPEERAWPEWIQTTTLEGRSPRSRVSSSRTRPRSSSSSALRIPRLHRLRSELQCHPAAPGRRPNRNADWADHQ
jgi:hypothetical protein